MVWKLALKNSKRYSIEVEMGARSFYKYSKYAVTEIKNDLSRHEDQVAYLKTVNKE